MAHGAGTLQRTLNGTAINWDINQAANGKWHGRVVVYLPGGIRCEGDFSHGRRVGPDRHSDSKAALERVKANGSRVEWIAEGHWEKDEFVLAVLDSRFAERRICPKTEQDRDLCVSQRTTLITTEETALANIHGLGPCMNHAETLRDIHHEKKTSEPTMVRYHGQAFEKLALWPRKKRSRRSDGRRADGHLASPVRQYPEDHGKTAGEKQER